MSARSFRALPRLLTLLAAIAALLNTTPASAQGTPPGDDDSCYACHEQLYRLHDVGKAFCLCGAPMECTCCHGGVTGELNEDAAHAGMVANPLVEDAPPCQSCHTDDTAAREAVFAARAGVSATPCPTMEAIMASVVPAVAPVHPAGIAGWQAALLLLVGVAFLGLAYFAYRCWKTDCASRRAPL